jgi:glycine/D-amino acid oxidase-like deaminating enzyme
MRAYAESADGPPLARLPSSDAVPKRCDIAIIGGGIIGLSTARELARAGVSVALFEKGEMAGEQSSRNWGWVRRTGRDLRELPLMQLSGEIWEGLNAATGHETGYRRSGIAYAARSLAAVERYRRWAAAAADFGVESTVLDGASIAAMAPGLTREVAGGLFTAADGRAEPQLANHAIARAAAAHGARLFGNCAVRTIDVSAGRTSGVVTERGLVRCGAVVVAGGAWSRLLLQGVGATLPQLKLLSSVLRTAPVEAGIEPCISFSDFALRRRLDGGYSVATSAVSISQIVPDSLRFFRTFLPAYLAERQNIRLRLGRAFLAEALDWRPGVADRTSIYEAVRRLSPRPDAATLSKVQKDLAKALPVFAGVPVVQSWAGMIDSTPDAIPVISEVASLPGCFVGTGFSGHGFGIGPGAGRVLAQLATGATPAVDLAAFDFNRFAAAPKLELQQWL